MAEQATPYLPPIYDNWTEFARRAAFIIGQILEGKTNNTGSITLTVDSLTTTLDDRRIGANSVVLLSASNELAGGEMGVFVNGYGKQTCTINHGSASTTRTFNYAVVG